MNRTSPAFANSATALEHAGVKNRYALLAAILALGLAVRLWSFGGMAGSDDVSIAGLAIKILDHGLTVPHSAYGVRLGLTLPLAGVFAVFGIGDWQVALIPLAMSMLGIWLAYAITAELAGTLSGLFAAFALALFPLDVLLATQYFPDISQGVSLAASFYLALRIRHSPRPYTMAILSGLVWGFAYFVKIEAVFFGATFLALAYWDQERWRHYFLTIVVFGVIVAGENIVYWLLTGIILYQVHVIRTTTNFVGSGGASGGGLWIFPKSWFLTFYHFGLYYYFLAAAWIWAIVTRRKEFYPVVVWVTVYLLWLQFGENPFNAVYSPKSHLDRYCTMISVPMAVLIGGMLASISRARKPVFLYGSMALLALPAPFFINFNTLDNERQTATKVALNYAVAHNLFPLYLDLTSYDIASYLLHGTKYADRIFPVQKHDFKTGTTQLLDVDALNGYLLWNTQFARFKAERYMMKNPDLEHLKRQDRLIYRVDNPMGASAYWETRLLEGIVELIPVRALRTKVEKTAGDLLEGEDALIFRLEPEKP